MAARFGLSFAAASAGLTGNLCSDPAHGKSGITRRNLLISGIAAATMSVFPQEATAADAIVTNVDDYRKALGQLSSHYPVALIDIGAKWCAFCKTVDGKILPDPRVRRAMKRVALVKVDVTKMDSRNRDLLAYLRADGPPTLFIVETATGNEYPGSRSLGAFRVDHLLRRLRPFT